MSRAPRGLIAGAVIAVCATATPGALRSGDMPALSLAPVATVSGVSSGAYMAVQMHVAYSSSICGAGVLAGGPFFCAQDGGLVVAMSSCETGVPAIPVAELAVVMATTAAAGYLDPLINLASSRVWLLSALNDTVVAHDVVRSCAELYEYYVPHAAVRFVENAPGEHAYMTTNFGNTCETLGSPYINNCGYDAAGEMLQWLFSGGLTPPTSADRARAGAGTLYTFSSAAFVEPLWTPLSGIAEEAYIYAPDACLRSAGGAACRLHVAFHGCEQAAADIGTDFVLHAGYVPWADANNLVVLFPQALANAVNPKGCWDWWGYTSAAYASNLGVQTSAVRRMMDAMIA